MEHVESGVATPKPRTSLVLGATALLGILVGFGLDRLLVSADLASRERENAALRALSQGAEQAEAPETEDWVTTLVDAWIDEPGPLMRYDAEDGLLKNVADGSVMGTFDAPSKAMLAERRQRVRYAWSFMDGSGYAVADSDESGEERARISLYAIEMTTGALTEVFSQECDGQCPAWYVLGKRDTELVIWPTGIDNSPGPCHSPWMEPLSSIDLTAPSKGLTAFETPAYKSALERHDAESCERAIRAQ